MAVEIALLKAARPDLDPSTEGLLRRIERLEQGTGSGEPTAEAPPVDEPEPETPVDSSEQPEPEASAEDDPPAGQLDLDQIINTWPAVLDKLRESSPALAATFDGARPVALDDEGLKVGFPAELTFNKRKAETPEKRELMANVIEDVLGERLRPTYVLLEEASAEPEEESKDSDREVDHDALLEKLKSEFNAEEVG